VDDENILPEADTPRNDDDSSLDETKGVGSSRSRSGYSESETSPPAPKPVRASAHRRRDRGWWIGGFLFGFAVGLVLSLTYGWVLDPRPLPGRPVDLRPQDKEQYLRLIALAFAHDNDEARARQRLANLAEPDIESTVVELTEKYIEQDHDIRDIKALVTLSRALGQTTSVMVAFVATPTPEPTATATPAPTPTARPTRTPTPSTPVPTATATFTPMSTSTSSPTPTDTAVPTPTATRTPTDRCGPSRTWIMPQSCCAESMTIRRSGDESDRRLAATWWSGCRPMWWPTSCATASRRCCAYSRRGDPGRWPGRTAPRDPFFAHDLREIDSPVRAGIREDLGPLQIANLEVPVGSPDRDR